MPYYIVNITFRAVILYVLI